MKAIGLIPSRYASARLPAQALLTIDGLPLIVHVYKRCSLARNLDDVCVCTDSDQIADAVQKHGGKVVFTSAQHATGTDRIAEAARTLEADIILDIYGDEPLVSPYCIDAVVEFHGAHPELDIILPSLPLENPISPHQIKVVKNGLGRVLYMSRNILPYPFGRSFSNYLRHSSVVSFKADALQRFGAAPQSELEVVESVELLRAFELGMTIGTLELESDSFSMNIEEDHERAKLKALSDEIRKQY